MDFLSLGTEQEEYMISLRRYLHQHPELSREEDKTVAMICRELEENGITFVDVPNGGVFGFLGSEQKGRTVLLRADIDALPVQESDVNEGGQPKTVVSAVEHVAHVCGHDAHTAMLLGAARALKQHENELEGRIILMFERGEEGGGNIAYLFKWLFDHQIHIDSTFAQHLVPLVPAGKISVVDGYLLAGSLSFSIKLHGRTAHGSEPYVGRSTIDCFAAIYGRLQEFRMKYASPYVPMVFSMGQVHAGASYNSIPDNLECSGSFRVFDFEDGMRIKDKLIEVVTKTAGMYDCTADIDIMGPLPSVVNDHECVLMARNVFKAALGSHVLMEMQPQMNSDSHSLTINTWPGVYMMLGTRNEEKGMTATAHDPHFEPDESVFKLGAACHMAYAVGFLQNGPDTSGRVFNGTLKEVFRKYRPRALDILTE